MTTPYVAPHYLLTIYVCMYVCIYIYIYIQTFVHTVNNEKYYLHVKIHAIINTEAAIGIIPTEASNILNQMIEVSLRLIIFYYPVTGTIYMKCQ